MRLSSLRISSSLLSLCWLGSGGKEQRRHEQVKRKFPSKSLLASFAAIEGSEVVDCNLLALLDISQCMDGVPSDVLVLAFPGVVVTGMIDTTCIKEDTPFSWSEPHSQKNIREYQPLI
jgi:hypothetical protein